MKFDGWRHLKVARPPYSSSVHLTPDVVIPRLRGSFGHPYIYEVVTESTQLMAPPDAPHGTVALAEHQTKGRGRLGRVWIDEPATGLKFSVTLRPPLPVSRWPEITLVAAAAVSGAVPRSTIKHPNDVLLDGLKVAGILADATDRVVLGIGINVGSTPWPDSGFVEADRLELLVEILERLELGYNAWVEGLKDS